MDSEAREVVATWLERQAQHGRSKLLVPELLALEEQLLGCTQQEHVAEWVRVLWQLDNGGSQLWRVVGAVQPGRAEDRVCKRRQDCAGVECGDG